ncbi:hypothetical protein BGX34_006189 [Mortierella sp. NVP85]|nr:hypothetical protein BGX34_006189 [Mortierella sp. NVP85]
MTRLQIMTSELEQEVKQLERAIAEQERKLAAKQAYGESVRESRQRSEVAKSIYKDLNMPMKPIPSNPISRSYVPETFLQDLNLSYLDTKGNREEAPEQPQSNLALAKELRSMTVDPQRFQEAQDAELENMKDTDTDSQDIWPLLDMDASTLTLEQVRTMGVDKWNKLIYVNALEGNFRNAERVLRLMEEAYSNAGRLESAQATIENMLKLGLIPPMPVYTSLMKIHVKRRDVTGTFRVFEALKKHHNPDIDVFTTLIKGCLRAGEHDLGWRVFDQMQSSGVTPVESTYSLMIRACARTDQVEKALDIFRSYPARRFQPTDITFNSLIHACAVRPEYFVTAFTLLNEMQNVYGFEPDILTYNTLLHACSKRRDLLTARRVFQKVVQLDYEGTLKLDGVTITNFLWCITEWRSMDEHLRNFKSRLRHPKQAQLEPAPVSEAATVDISVSRPYFMLPETPPRNEREALGEGELVFSWFISRCAEQFPALGTEDTSASQEPGTDQPGSEQKVTAQDDDAPNEGNSDFMDDTVTQISTVDLPLPRVSTRSPIRSRLLNAYLAMYVRHQDIEASTRIYRKYFDYFRRKRDSWTYSIMLEGCYNWKDVDLGTEVFRDWRDWRKSTGKLTDKHSRNSDYQCYRRMINLLARTDHLDESIALLEELSIAATPVAASSSSTTTALTPSLTEPSDAPLTSDASASLAFLEPIQDDFALPIYPQLKDFPVVYTRTWELEDENARKLLLRLCHGNVGTLSASLPQSLSEDTEPQEETVDHNSILPTFQDKRRARYQRALRNTAIKWKGEHPQEKGFYMGSRRIRELEQNPSKRGQDQRRRN